MHTVIFNTKCFIVPFPLFILFISSNAWVYPAHVQCTMHFENLIHSFITLSKDHSVNHSTFLGSAFHPFLNPSFSITFAGIQYTGSKSSSPGYPSNDNPINQRQKKSDVQVVSRCISSWEEDSPATPKCVWKTSAAFSGRSAMPPFSVSCAESMNSINFSELIQCILFSVERAERTQKL